MRTACKCSLFSNSLVEMKNSTERDVKSELKNIKIALVDQNKTAPEPGPGP